jgi:hypothetical protein
VTLGELSSCGARTQRIHERRLKVRKKKTNARIPSLK